MEALHAHNTSLASKFPYIGSDENASAQKEADTEMEAALKRSTEKQEQIARDVINAEQETEEEPEQEDAEALQEEPEYEKEETDILEESSEPETDEEDEETGARGIRTAEEGKTLRKAGETSEKCASD